MTSILKSKYAIIGSAVALLATFVILRVFFIDYYRIPQNGMYPTFAANSLLFAVKRPYKKVENVRRGDIVIFTRNENGQAYNFIWRVIALPGDKIETVGESLTLNGQPVARKRLREMDGKIIYREILGGTSYEIALDHSPRFYPANISITVPSNQFFVMGDNRFNARDSRYFGPIDFDSISGKTLGN